MKTVSSARRLDRGAGGAPAASQAPEEPERSAAREPPAADSAATRRRLSGRSRRAVSGCKPARRWLQVARGPPPRVTRRRARRRPAALPEPGVEKGAAHEGVAAADELGHLDLRRGGCRSRGGWCCRRSPSTPSGEQAARDQQHDAAHDVQHRVKPAHPLGIELRRGRPRAAREAPPRAPRRCRGRARGVAAALTSHAAAGCSVERLERSRRSPSACGTPRAPRRRSMSVTASTPRRCRA